MAYTTSQILTYVNDSLVTNTANMTSLSAAVTGTDAGATLLIEGSNDGSTWSTLNTITTASTVSVAFGTYPIVRARISVQGSGSFLVAFTATIANAGTVITNTLSDTALTPTVTAAAYTAGNVVGGLLTFTNVFGQSLRGTLTDIVVKSKSVQTTTYKLYLFSQQPSNSTWTDKAAPAINAADIPFILGVYTTGAADSGLGTETTNQLNNIASTIRSNSQNLYGVLVCVATPTYASTSDVSVAVRVRQQ